MNKKNFSKIGVLLSVIGSAIGLGNIWGFPTAFLKHGGLIFLFPYFISLFFLGFPVLILEFTIGNKWRTSPLISYKKYWKKGGSFIAGFQTFGQILIGSYYVWFITWIILTLFNILGDDLQNVNFDWFDKKILNNNIKGEGIFTFTNYFSIIICVLIFGFAFIVSIVGIKRGIEKVNKIAIPLLFVLILGLLIYSFFIKGGYENGIKPLMTPNFNLLNNPKLWSDAFGRALFSLSLCSGVVVIFSAKSPKNTDKVKQAILVIISDTIVGLFAVFIIISTLGGMVESELLIKKVTLEDDKTTKIINYFFKDNSSGKLNNILDLDVNVVFSVLPVFFSKIGNIHIAKFIAFIFFTCLFLAGFSSWIGQIETGVSTFQDLTPLTERKKTTLLVILIQFISGSFYLFAYNQKIGEDVTDGIFIIGTLLITAFIFLLMMVLQPKKVQDLVNYSNEDSKFKIGKWFYYILVVSLVIVGLVILLSSIDFFSKLDKWWIDGKPKYSIGQWFFVSIMFWTPYIFFPCSMIIYYFKKNKKILD